MHNKLPFSEQSDIAQSKFYPLKRFIQASMFAYNDKHVQQLSEMIQESLEKTQPKPTVEEIKVPRPLPTIPIPVGFEIRTSERKKHFIVVQQQPTLKESNYSVQVSEKISEKIDIKKDQNFFIYNLTESLSNDFIAEAKNMIDKKYQSSPKILDNSRFIRKINKKVSKKLKIPYKDENTDLLSYYLKRDFENFGRITPLLNDANIKEISCDGIDKPLSVKIANQEIKTNIVFTKNKELDQLINNMAKRTNRSVSQDKPILDSLFGTIRFQATLGNNSISSKFLVKKNE